MKNPYSIIVQSAHHGTIGGLSYGDARIREEANLVRKYTFIVATDANKIEIKTALEAIYNAGRRRTTRFKITSVRTIKVLGKKRRRLSERRATSPIEESDRDAWPRARCLEDYGV